MKLEYKNGVRLTKLLHEQTPFEQMLDRYTEQAKKHYATALNTTLSENERSQALKESLAFLENERRHLETMGDIQAQLECYRVVGQQATKTNKLDRNYYLNVLVNEKHHPASVLEKYMRAEGIPKPSAKHTAHHIVPGKGKIQILMNRTRVHLHTHGIRINDSANGVYLIRKDEDTPHWSMPKSKGHLTYHTHEYEIWVAQKIRALNNIDLIKTQMQIIGRILQENEPKNAIPSNKNR